MSVVSSAYDNFISGPTAQSTSNDWQYFEINSARSSANLLPSWQNGNEVIYTYGQWDNNRFGGNYPFIQKVTGSGTINGNYGSSFTGPALVMHPDDNSEYNICLGYKNNTASTITATVDISLSLLFPDRNSDGVNYYIQRGLVNGTRYLSYVSSSIPSRSTSTYTFTNSSIEIQAGELIYLTINKNGAFSYDHVRVGFTVTYTGTTPSPTYNSIPQVSKTIGVDASFSLAAVMIGASNSSGAYTFSSTSTAISISGDIATILEYTPSAITVNVSQASTETYAAGNTTFSLLISRRTSTFSASTFTVASSKTAVDPSFAITTRPTSDSSGAVTYSSSNTNVATITEDGSGNAISIVAAGTVTFTATQAATSQFTESTITSNQLTVSLGTPTLSSSTFVVPTSKVYGDASFAIVTRPTSNSSGAITYTSNNTAVATIDTSGNWITLVGAGDVSFNAIQAAVPNQFTSASIQSDILTVSIGTPTLSSATFIIANTSKVYGDPSFAILTRPTSNSSGAITYTSNNPAVATIDTSGDWINCLLYTSPSPRDRQKSRMPSSA